MIKETKTVPAPFQQQEPAQTPSIMNRQDLAKYLRISIYLVDAEVRKGLPYFTVGKRDKRFRKTEVDKWFDVKGKMRR